MPSSRKRPCAIVIVVFATITEGTLASSGTRPRRSHALTASPPSAAVGVARLKASPASRTPRRVRKATPSRRNANRQPSVSNTMTRTAGKQTTIARRQESWTIEARIAAGARVRGRQEEAAAARAEEREDERRPPGAHATRADHPLEGRKHDDQQDEHAVLEHGGIRPALPEPQGPEGPGAGVVADHEKPGEHEEDQRPVARPARAAGRVEDREEPHGEHEQPGDVVVELGPRAVRGGPRGVAVVHPH